MEKMTDHEICYNYRSAKNKYEQIQTLAELNATNRWEIIKILARGGEKLTKRTESIMQRRLETLEAQIREREKEYREIAEIMKGA